MKKLNKYEIFKMCGFGDGAITMPKLIHGAYDQVLDLCYNLGYTEAITGLKPFQLDTYTKDLENSNIRLRESNRLLQVVNEKSLKEIEHLNKTIASLRDDKSQLCERFDEHVKMITELREKYLEENKAFKDNSHALEGYSKYKFVITVEEL